MVIYRSPDLRHVAARDGDGFVAVLDKQLGGAGMRDDLLHLAEIDLTWKFNEARSKYRGSGAGEKQKARM